jgi:glycine hydroxymethyltransferase
MARLKEYLEKTPESKRTNASIAYLASLDEIEKVHPDVASSIVKELEDQRSNLKLIASENFSSPAVQLAMGNLLTDKYAEGFPGHRFYAGCDNIDAIEGSAAEELKNLFNAEFAYIQPHSGADANLIAFWTILIHRVQNPAVEKLGKKSVDELTPEEYETIRQEMLKLKVMGLSLSSGGHLTHGYIHNVSSKMMRSVVYDVDPKTEMLDYDQIAKRAKAERPDILIAGYSAHPRRYNFAKMREIADSVGAVLMSDIAHFAGLVAGKVFQGEEDPIPYSDIVTSTTHKSLRGPRGGIIMAKSTYGDLINKGCPLVMGGPLPHVLAAKAIAFREANTPAFRTYAQNIVKNAKALAEGLMKRGIRLVSNGTDNHLVLMDVGLLGLTGRQAELILRESGLTVNRNSIPNDQNGAWYTSGIRLGTPATTTLGMGTAEMDEIADIISSVLKAAKPAIVEKTGEPSKAKYILDESIKQKAKSRVHALLHKYPLYPEIVL